MQPPCAPLSRRMRVSLRVSMPAMATISPSTRNCGSDGSRASSMQQRQVADHEARGVDRIRLDVLGVDAGVADVRIGERDDLPGVRRIGQDLLVARHRRVEDDFAGRIAGGADRNAPKHRAVREREHCRCRCHQGVLPVLSRRSPARGAGSHWMESSWTPSVISCCTKRGRDLSANSTTAGGDSPLRDAEHVRHAVEPGRPPEDQRAAARAPVAKVIRSVAGARNEVSPVPANSTSCRPTMSPALRLEKPIAPGARPADLPTRPCTACSARVAPRAPAMIRRAEEPFRKARQPCRGDAPRGSRRRNLRAAQPPPPTSPNSRLTASDMLRAPGGPPFAEAAQFPCRAASSPVVPGQSGMPARSTAPGCPKARPAA